MTTHLSFHDLVIQIHIYATEIAALIVFIVWLTKHVWRELKSLKSLFRRPMHK